MSCALYGMRYRYDDVEGLYGGGEEDDGDGGEEHGGGGGGGEVGVPCARAALTDRATETHRCTALSADSLIL